MRRDIDIGLLRAFVAVVESGSVTDAARLLNLTQAAVSQQLKRLEELFGTQLFERRHKALALTEAGRAYFRTVGPVLDQLRDSTRRLRESGSQKLLTVTTTISFASMWLVPRLARFRKDHPHVDVRVAASTDVVDIEREGIDLAIRDMRPETAPPGAIALMGDHVAPVCSANYLKENRAAKRPLAKPEDLRHHVLLHMHDPHGRFPFISWPGWLEAHGLPDLVPEGSLVFGQYDQVIHAAMHGQGVALGRMSLLAEDVRDKRLVTLFGKSQRISRVFHAIYAKSAASRTEAKELVQWLKQEIAKEQ
jgi:DNA-binding transcriptional LysR family regulator